jgi:hypothetical protein
MSALILTRHQQHPSQTKTTCDSPSSLSNISTPPNLASNPQPLLSPWINNQTPIIQPLSAAIFHKHTVITVPTFILSIPAIATPPKTAAQTFPFSSLDLSPS